MNKFQELTDFLDEYNVEYTVNSRGVKVDGDLNLGAYDITSLPESFGNLKMEEGGFGRKTPE